MKDTENQRLKFLMSELGFKTQTAFAQALNIKAGTLSDILREKPGVGVSANTKRLLENSYNININWLETGEGKVFLESSFPTVNENVVEYGYHLNKDSEKEISYLKRIIADKETIISKSEELIRDKVEIINLLKEQLAAVKSDKRTAV